MRRVLSVGVSVLLVAGAVYGLRWYVEHAGRRRLEVVMRAPPYPVDTPVDFEVVRRPPGRLSARVGGARRIEDPERLRLDPNELGPGLHGVDFELDYLGRPPRQVGFGLLVGPFRKAGAPLPCSVRVVVTRRVTDVLADALIAGLKRRLTKAPLPRVRTAQVALNLVSGGIDAKVRAEFEGDSEVEAQLPMGLRFSPGGDLELYRRGPVEAEATGALGTLAALKGGGIVAAIAKVIQDPSSGIDGALAAAKEAGDREAAREVERTLDAFLPEVNRALADAVPRRFGGEVLGARVAAHLSPCGSPIVQAGEALVLRYDAAVRVEDGSGGVEPGGVPAAASRVPGPVRLHAEGLTADAAAGSGDLVVSVSVDVLNALLDAAWRAGALGRIAADPEMLRRVNARLAGLASFRVESVSLPLPPVVEVRGGEVVAAAREIGVTLSRGDGRSVTLAAGVRGRVEATVEGGTLHLGARGQEASGSCSKEVEGGVLRWPCYPELIEGFSEVLARRGSVAARLPARWDTGLFPIEVTGVDVRDGAVHLRARAVPP